MSRIFEDNLPVVHAMHSESRGWLAGGLRMEGNAAIGVLGDAHEFKGHRLALVDHATDPQHGTTCKGHPLLAGARLRALQIPAAAQPRKFVQRGFACTCGDSTEGRNQGCDDNGQSLCRLHDFLPRQPTTGAGFNPRTDGRPRPVQPCPAVLQSGRLSIAGVLRSTSWPAPGAGHRRWR